MFNRDVVFPVLIMLISAITLAFIPQFSVPSYYQKEASVGAKFFPTVLATAQFLICIALLIQYKKSKIKPEKPEKIFSKMSIFGLVFLIFYGFLIHFLGYLIASLIAFTLYLAYLKNKNLIYYLVAWIFVVAIYYLFGQIFLISLPEGIF